MKMNNVEVEAYFDGIKLPDDFKNIKHVTSIEAPESLKSIPPLSFPYGCEFNFEINRIFNNRRKRLKRSKNRRKALKLLVKKYVYIVIVNDEIQGVYAYENDAIEEAKEIDKKYFDILVLVEKHKVV